MEKKTGDIEKYELALVVLVVGVFVRSILTFLFLDKYGEHAARTEFWHWYAIAQGLQPIDPLDPTKWLFDLTSMVFGTHLDQGIMILAIGLSALTGVLIFFLVDFFYERQVAFLAGMIYTLMEESIYYGVAGFVHDLVQIPLMMLCLLFIIKAIDSRDNLKRVGYALFSITMFYFSSHASKSIYVLLGVLLFYFLLACTPKISKRLNRDPSKTYFLVLTLALAISGIFTVSMGPDLFDDILGTLPQGRYGSSDITPLTLDGLWLRINIFLYFIPAGILATFRRRDGMTLSFILAGLILSVFVARGTRILEIGLAIAIAHAFTGWKKQWTVPSAVFLVCSLITIALVTNRFGVFLPLYFLSIALTASFLFLKRRKADESKSILPLLILSCFLVGYVFFVHSPSIIEYSTETEYQALKWLAVNNRGDKTILMNWGKGDMATVLANATTVSNYNMVDAVAHKSLWRPERETVIKLSEREIDYVMVTSRDLFTFNDSTPKRYFVHGLMLEPPGRFLWDMNDSTPVSEMIMVSNNFRYVLKEDALNASTIYKMRYKPEALNHFSLIYENDNKYINVRLFESNFNQPS